MALGPWITADDKAAVMAVLDSGDLMSGREVAAFEEELAAYLGKRHVVCVSSGTAALECALQFCDEGRKIHPDGHVALLSAARAAGVEPECAAGLGVKTWVLGIDPGKVHTRVVDCSHAFQKGGASGEVQCYSFNANKFIACCGGALATNDSVVAAYARHYRNHGRDGGPEIHRSGRNLRMGEMNAALGRSQLKRIADIHGFRKQVVDWYAESLSMPAARSSWFLFPVNLGRKDHGQRSMADFRLFETAEDIDHCTALLPVWPTMTREEVAGVVKGLEGK